MEVSKIHLSPAEAELIQNADIILTKNRVLEKVRMMLEIVQDAQLDFIRTALHAPGIFDVPPKISRGENYLGLPYTILDYPRKSTGTEICFVRLMFWWGKFFSATLHVSGQYKKNLLDNRKPRAMLPGNLFIGVGADPWAHHFEGDNYCPVASLNDNEFLQCLNAYDHLKLAVKWTLDEWDEMPGKLLESWKQLMLYGGLIA